MVNNINGVIDTSQYSSKGLKGKLTGVLMA